jgi:vacuolar-type H+-ATPase subunit F/Vma7
MTAYVLGEEEVVLGFGLIGVPGFVPMNRDDALREFVAAAARPGPVLILVTEAVARWISAEIRDAVIKGMMVQVIPGLRAAPERREDSEAALLSALGIRL